MLFRVLKKYSEINNVDPFASALKAIIIQGVQFSSPYYLSREKITPNQEDL